MERSNRYLLIIGITAVLLAVFYFITKIFSVGISLLLLCIVGTITGLILKDKFITKIFAVGMVIVVIFIAIFYILLVNSNM